MKNHSQSSGRILRHGAPASEVTAEAIEARARELALIEGREQPNDEDRRHSRAELRGDHLPDTSLDDAEGVGRLSRDPSDPLSIEGVRSPMQNEPLEQEILERLALEGVEEAQHDQMLAARRRRRHES